MQQLLIARTIPSAGSMNTANKDAAKNLKKQINLMVRHVGSIMSVVAHAETVYVPNNGHVASSGTAIKAQRIEEKLSIGREVLYSSLQINLPTPLVACGGGNRCYQE